MFENNKLQQYKLNRLVDSHQKLIHHYNKANTLVYKRDFNARAVTILCRHLSERREISAALGTLNTEREYLKLLTLYKIYVMLKISTNQFLDSTFGQPRKVFAFI